MDNNKLAQALMIQKGLQQFEFFHQPKPEDPDVENPTLICGTCDVDFPCQRYLDFMVLQALASLTAMIPTGNVANVMARFSGKQ